MVDAGRNIESECDDDDIDDACVGCQARSGFDCLSCGYYLASINKLENEPLRRMDVLRKLLLGRTPMTNSQIASELQISEGGCSKAVSAAVAAGLVRRVRMGREVAISWILKSSDVGNDNGRE